MRYKIFAIGFLVLAGLVISIDYKSSGELTCSAPLLHLGKADVDVCIQPSVSMVYMTFDKPINVSLFTSNVEKVFGIDIDNAKLSDDHKTVLLVYYMSETRDAEFLGNVVSAIDDSRLFN